LIKKSGKKIALFAAVAVFAFAFAIAISGAHAEKPAFAENKDKGFYTFLICGTDAGGRNTDVMMLATLDVRSPRLNILQIPRDTFVNPEASGLGITRVNAIYGAEYARAEGGERERRAMEALCRFLEGALCVEIDRYVLMDTGALASAVDAVGGIEFDVPAEMHYDDPEQGLHIHLPAGKQMLDGKKAEMLLRYRSGYATGDLGRVDVRSRFLGEAISQVKKKMSPAAAAKTAVGLAFSVTTDASIYEISRYAASIFKVDDENVNIKTIAGSAVQNPKTGAWIYYALNKEAALDDINEYINAGRAVCAEDFDRNAVFTDDPHGENPYISKYYYSKIKKE
jgi:LCP family protein required for cell wall assembly